MMNIGIIIYSQTGNTRKVAEQLKEKLTASGHSASIAEILPEGGVKPGPGSVVLKQTPDASSYDAVILGAPVQAFSLNPVMKSYLPDMGRISGKKAALFVTKQLHKGMECPVYGVEGYRGMNCAHYFIHIIRGWMGLEIR